VLALNQALLHLYTSRECAYQLRSLPWELIYPVDLVAVVPIPDAGYPGGRSSAILLLAALTAGAYFYRREKPFLLVDGYGIWDAGAGDWVMQTRTRHTRIATTYLPTMGLDWRHMGGRGLGRPNAGRRLALKLPAWPFSERSQYLLAPDTVLRDSMTLWTHTLDCTQDNAQATKTLGWP